MERRFSGWHAFAIISGGFLIVAAVNALLAVMALRTNQATVVDNAYVASQSFNDGLAAGRAQQALGWNLQADVAGGQLQLTARDAQERPLRGLAGEVTLTHPLGSEAARTLALRETGDGVYVAAPVPGGRWIAEFRLQAGGDAYYLRQRIASGR